MKYINTLAVQESIRLDPAVWDDFRVAAEQTAVTPATSKPDRVTFQGNTKVLGFDPINIEGITFSIQFPHGQKVRTKVRPHLHWSPLTADVGGVIWKLEYTYTAMGGTFPPPQTIAAPVSSVNNEQFKHLIVAFPEIDTSALTNVSWMMLCYLYRDPTDPADNYAADAGLLEFDIHYLIDSLGSLQENTK